jgi:hypothetical protein
MYDKYREIVGLIAGIPPSSKKTWSRTNDVSEKNNRVAEATSGAEGGMY